MKFKKSAVILCFNIFAGIRVRTLIKTKLVKLRFTLFQNKM